MGLPIVYRTLAEQTPLLRALGDEVPDAALLAAVLLLGEAIRTRRALAAEQQRSERLLLNVLPAPIATRLKAGEAVIADAFPEVTVLFADLVDFTRSSRRSSPAQVVATLNELFSAFDELAQHHGLEKIKTIGDAYMVAGGLPQPRPDHAQAVAELALAMREEVARRSDSSGGQQLQVRIGIGTRPGGGRGDRHHQVQLRPVGRHRQHRQPDGVPRGVRLHPGDRTHLPAATGWLPVPAPGTDPRQGKGEMVTWFLLGRDQ